MRRQARPVVRSIVRETRGPIAFSDCAGPAAPPGTADVASPESIVKRVRDGLHDAHGRSFITWIDDGWRPIIGTPNDRGFAESSIAAKVEQNGDIAHVMSTDQKHRCNDTQILGRGINSIQMVREDGRWRITSVLWDEETGAGPIPAKYLSGRSRSRAGVGLRDDPRAMVPSVGREVRVVLDAEDVFR